MHIICVLLIINIIFEFLHTEEIAEKGSKIVIIIFTLNFYSFHKSVIVILSLIYIHMYVNVVHGNSLKSQL